MFWWLVQNTLLAGALALAAALAGRFARLSPAVRHALWLVVLVKLVTPPLALYSLPEGEPWSDWLVPAAAREAPRQASRSAALHNKQAVAAIVDSQPIAPENAMAETAAVPATGPVERPVIDLGEIEVAAAPKEREAGVVVDLDSPQSRDVAVRAIGADSWHARPFSWLRLALVGVWVFGAGCMILLQAVRLRRFRHLLRNAEEAPRSLTALVAEIAAQLGVAPPQAVLTSAACSPMIFAFGRPRLIWPNSLAEPLTGDARRAVIAHELAHLRRRDHWVAWLELAASCGWWWNPLFWYVRRRLRETAELACDAWVVSLLPGGRRAYAQALIDVSELISWTAAPAPAVGMGASARHLFERRLTMILRERVPCRAPLVGLALIGLLTIAVLPAWTKGQAPVPALPSRHRVAERPETGNAVHKIPTTRSMPQEGEAPVIQKGGAAGSRLSRTVIARQVTDRYVLKPSEDATANHKLAKIKQLEAHLAALDSELRMLRGAEQGDEQHVAEIESLTRAKYKLPPGRAEALAAFIKEHVKDDVETRIDGETLVVTATADDQARIGQFVQLLKKTPEVREQPEEGGDAAEDSQGKSNDAFAPPIGIDVGLPVPVDEPVAPASGTPSFDSVDSLPGLDESEPQGPLPPPPADAVPTTIN